MKNKFLKPALALALVAAMAVGGSLAYITATTDTFENKFVAANSGDLSKILAINLDETFTLDGVDVADLTDGVAKFLPGDEIVKAPVVKVTANELETGAYVFVKLADDANVMDLGFTMKAGWTPLTDADTEDAVDVTGVWYQTTTGTPTLDVFDNTTITIDNDDITGNKFADVQTLTVDSYAIQTANLDTAYDAWVALGK